VAVKADRQARPTFAGKALEASCTSLGRRWPAEDLFDRLLCVPLGSTSAPSMRALGYAPSRIGSRHFVKTLRCICILIYSLGHLMDGSVEQPMTKVAPKCAGPPRTRANNSWRAFRFASDERTG
jgi:hypothetical protein